MRAETEALLELVMAEVMASPEDALALWRRLRRAVPQARVTSLIRALLCADRVIGETFRGGRPSHPDALLARRFALTLAEAADDLEAAAAAEARGAAPDGPGRPLTLADLPL